VNQQPVIEALQKDVVRLIALHPNARQAERTIDRPLSVLGSGPASDLILASSRIEAAHAVLVRIGGGVFLGDLGAPSGTRLNGRSANWQRVYHGDEFELGPFSYRIELAGFEDGVVGRLDSYRLRDERRNTVAESRDPILLIGRDPACEAVINDNNVSSRHAVIVQCTAGPLLRDLTGRTGLRCNGRPVREAILRDGDAIGIAGHEFVFECASCAASGNGSGRGASSSVSAWGGGTARDAVAEADVEATSDTAPVDEALALDMITAPAPREPDEMECASREDAEVLEFVEELEELNDAGPESDRSTTSPERRSVAKRGASDAFEGLRAEPSLRIERQELETCAPDLKARVIAAQHALDERARKLQSQLDAERERLKDSQRQLQEQAKRLLEANHPKSTAAWRSIAGEESKAAGSGNGMNHASDKSTVIKRRTGPELRPELSPLDEIDRLFAGTIVSDTAAQHAGRTRAFVDSGPPGGASIGSNGQELQEQVAGLADVVRSEREQMDHAEGRLESLRFEIDRLRTHVVRAREKQVIQESEADARIQAAEHEQSILRQERESAVARLRRLDTKYAAITTRLEDARRIRKDLEAEAERLAREQEQHDDRLRELRITLEGERHRLRVRQAELQRKASDLAKLARSRRRAIEQVVTEHYDELKQQETEIKAKRTAIAEAGRAELERTATELEQLLSMRLADIESELSARKENLDSWMKTILETAQPFSGEPPTSPPGESGAPARSPLQPSEEWTAPAGETEGEGRHLAMLEKELEGLHQAVMRFDDDPERRRAPGDQSIPGSSESRLGRLSKFRLSGSRTARLGERVASLRKGLPGEPAAGEPQEGGEVAPSGASSSAKWR
jgi:pSer/pThr/pTyr-binding forkhead associated (FHA) protein